MKARSWLMVISLFLVLGGLSEASFAAPRAHVGFGLGVRAGHFGPFYRPFPSYYWGFGGPWWQGAPWYPYQYPMEVVRVNYGTVEFRVKPDSSKVYVDQKYLGTVEELQGRHHEAKLPGGYHDVKVVAPDGRTVERTIFVALGEKIKFEQKFG